MWAEPLNEELQTFSISDLAREYNITPRTIRHYEGAGLVAPTRIGVHRVYSRRDRTRLKLALRGKRLGLSLNEIKELIDLYDLESGEHSQLKRLLGVLAKRRKSLEQQQEDIAAVLAELQIVEQQCLATLANVAATK